MIVLKFGGTSVGTPQRMKALPELITSQPGETKIVVLSAISGVTDQLVALHHSLQKGEVNSFQKGIDTLEKLHFSFVEALFQQQRNLEIVKPRIAEQLKQLRKYSRSPYATSYEGSILATGELLSTLIFHHYLKELSIDNELLYAPNFIHLNQDDQPNIAEISTRLIPQLKTSSAKLFIIQGFICEMVNHTVGNLKRGGSDYTASLIGAAIKAKEVQIWTDIDGLHNNDPRFVSGTRPIRTLSYDEAAELAYFGAKVLHPQSIHPARSKSVPVRLLNTMNPSSPGTLITKEAPIREVVALAAKDHITAIKIHSSRMLMAYGFLKGIFEIFEKHKTPIDMITTSEVAVSLTIDNTLHLSEILKELRAFGVVEVDKEQSIVCIVGNFSSESHGKAALITDALKHLPIRMISYGGSTHNLSVLIPKNYKIEALRALQSRLF